MHKRHVRLLSGLVALGLLTAACGNDDETSDDTTTTAASGDQTTTTAGDGGSADSQVKLDDVCQEAKDAGVEAPDGYTVRLVTDIGKVDDRTFNQYAYEGMKAAEECFGFETSFIETASEADYEKNISTAMEGDPDVIITVGFLLADATLAAANANTGTDFIGVDQFQPEYPDNYIGVLFNEDEGGYMAGVLAASLSESGTIGVVGGRQDVPPVVKLVNGYEAGAKSINPAINVLKIYNESFTAPDKGASDAQQFIGEGADVIFGAGGQTGSGGVAAATEQGVWGIGVDQDEYFTTFNGGSAPGADKLASSAVKRVDLGVFLKIVDALKGEFKGGVFALTAANGGITYAPAHDAKLPDEAVQAVEKARQGLADGSIKTGLDPATGLPK
ncbi:MAG TPA: BMP family ABC transporter substrate-binding protein [Acidimicrobiales bacterium]|nr:BMP family ABC transporter substrate-binding protein [Acidimicrobiales bacterium]